MIAALFVAAMLSSARQVPAVPAPPPLVRVFVHTDDVGDAAELRARRDSVKDMRDALAEKKKTVSIVDAEDEADVVVEVLDRGVTIPKVVFGGVTTTNGPPGTGIATPAKAVHLKVKLTCHKEFLAFTNKNSPTESNGGWKSAAQDIAKQMDKWLTEHRAEVLAGRGGVAISQAVH